VHIIGYPCKGVIDNTKVAAALEGKVEPGLVSAVKETEDTLELSFPDQTITLKKNDVVADKCSRCLYPNAVLSDTFEGEQREPVVTEDPYADLEAFEKLSLEERQAFWEKEMSRCIRCYACRNACPLCVCRDHCVATSREPHWLSQADSTREKLFFQLIHATHLAGRCTGCGECSRACPVDIPVGLFKRTMTRAAAKMFDFEGGVNPEAALPLQTFAMEEPTIKEREW
ncbi:MAG TPA: 4Fe-4S ferredoxin, partial [Desulfobulbaceae bacterium]|nr:4Fe-4S ferredoxin [Desulfobulbaceae bacterium]